MERLADQGLAHAGTVAVRGINKVNAYFGQPTEDGQGFGSVGWRSPDAFAGNAHRAEAKPRDRHVTTDDELASAIAQSAERTHERCWRMPLTQDYRELLKSDVADINNMPRHRYGAAITAALFLSEFAAGTRWAHIDIAGPAFHKKASAYCGPGATGFGVRLLCDVVLGLEAAL